MTKSDRSLKQVSTDDLIRELLRRSWRVDTIVLESAFLADWTRVVLEPPYDELVKFVKSNSDQ